MSKDGLKPIGEIVKDALSGLPAPVKELREASPQALHHFTRFDQVNQLVSASEADPERGFMARTMALCSLPRTNPGDRLQYRRVNGPGRGTRAGGWSGVLGHEGVSLMIISFIMRLD